MVTLYKNFTEFLLQCVFLYPLNLNNYDVTLNKVRFISRRLRDYTCSFFGVSYFYNFYKDKYNEFGNVLVLKQG